MAIDPVSQILQHLHQAAYGNGPGLSDGQLLERYLHHREDAAFAALVRRHGPMVMSVCRRVLGNEHDAEDAFQACFLVLVRKAASVVPRERVANFLHGVAHTTAVRARGLLARRRTREKQVAQLPEPEARPPELWDDLRPLLDLELSRLPDKYRVPIILCDLEDRPIKEAAQQLGWPQGTLAGRLARARVMLAKRLARRGLTVSGGALAVVLTRQARSASLPARVISGTIEAARLFAAGQAATDALSASVVALTEGVLKTMFLSKLKIVTAVVAVLAVLALSAAGGLYEALAGDTPQPKTPTAPPTADDAPMPRAPTQANPPQVDSTAASPSEPSVEYELPIGGMPRQVLVRMVKDRVLVRTLEVNYEAVPMVSNGQQVVTTQKVEVWRVRHYPINVIKVYDMKGKRIDAKLFPKLLPKETVALFTTNEQEADPVNLRLFKEGTLLFVLSFPVPQGVPPDPAARYGQGSPVPARSYSTPQLAPDSPPVDPFTDQASPPPPPRPRD